MNTRTRLSVTALAACVTVAALTGCAASAPTPSPSATTAIAGDETPVPSTSPTATDAPTPETPSTPSSSPSQGSGTPALAQHIHDECSKGAADAGVTLTFTEDPSGYTGSDGTYQLIYPFTFDDGHTDPYAIYNCTLTDDTVDSSYVSSGMTDSH